MISKTNQTALAALIRLLPRLDLSWPEEQQATWWNFWGKLWEEVNG